MSDPRTCPQCGSLLPADAPDGLCPKCLLQLGFESQAGAAPDPARSPTGYQPRFLPPSIEELAAQFPQLEILEKIGHGGMGVVYKARQRDLDRIVALKILRPDIEGDPAFAERFVREARALAKLSHPAIVTVHDFGRKDSLYYFVMEYVAGTNLRELERSGKLAPHEALAIVPRICEALQYAHDQGVVHRDIKPENILIDRDGRVKIADFGLAKVLGTTPESMALTGAWQVMGTPHYMAPEQMQGAHQVDHRADIYSLGVVIYEMLTGELPVGRFALPSQKVRVDVRLDDVVLRAMEREPARRYQRVSDVQTDIETVSRETHSAAAPSGSMPPAGWYYGLWGTQQPGYAKWVRGRMLLWLPIWLLLALAALVLGALAGSLNEPLFGMVIGAGVVLFPLWLLLLKQDRAARRQPPYAEARTTIDDSGNAVVDSEAARLVAARTAVATPAQALIAVGVFEWIACWVSCIVLGVVAISYGEQVPQWLGDRDTLGMLLPTLFILGAILSGLVIVAGFKMRRLESWGFALAGSVLAMFVSPGNVIGLPIGLWALYVLTRAEVKAAFQRQSGTASGESSRLSARELVKSQWDRLAGRFPRTIRVVLLALYTVGLLFFFSTYGSGGPGFTQMSYSIGAPVPWYEFEFVAGKSHHMQINLWSPIWLVAAAAFVALHLASRVRAGRSEPLSRWEQPRTHAWLWAIAAAIGMAWGLVPMIIGTLS